MRAEDKEAEKRIRGRKFQPAVKSALEEKDTQLRARYEVLYDTLIHKGAHPNELAFEPVENTVCIDGDSVSYMVAQLCTEDARQEAYAISGQVGVFIASAINHMVGSGPTGQEMRLELDRAVKEIEAGLPTRSA